jgi:hypothetical protein
MYVQKTSYTICATRQEIFLLESEYLEGLGYTVCKEMVLRRDKKQKKTYRLHFTLL